MDSTASHSWPTWAPASESPSVQWSSWRSMSTPSTSSLARRAFTRRAQTGLVDGEVEEDVERVHAPLVGEGADALADQLGMGRSTP